MKLRGSAFAGDAASCGSSERAKAADRRTHTGMCAIHTPGHTSGHCSLHLPDRGVLLDDALEAGAQRLRDHLRRPYRSQQHQLNIMASLTV